MPPIKGKTIGHYKGRDIVETLTYPGDGRHYVYAGIALLDSDGGTPLAQLGDNEIIVAPGLIYRQAIQAADLGNGC